MRQRDGRIGPVARHGGDSHSPLTIGMLVGGYELDAAAPALRYRCAMLVGHLHTKIISPIIPYQGTLLA